MGRFLRLLAVVAVALSVSPWSALLAAAAPEAAVPALTTGAASAAPRPGGAEAAVALGALADTWTQLSPGGPLPPAREDHSGVWDAAGNRMLVFGGWNPTLTFLNDLWSYQAASNTWIQLSPGGPLPGTRYEHSAVWDAVGSRMLVFGGFGGTLTALNDLWSYQAATNTWTQLSPIGTPPSPRRDHTAVWDPVGNRMLVYGGWNGVIPLSDLWSYQAATSTWIQLSPGGVLPPARGSHTAVWDAAGNRMLVFGGSTGVASYLNDLRSYQAGSNMWTQLIPGGSLPPARERHSAVWDTAGNRLLVFGGWNGARWNDLWSYQATGNAWAQLSPGGSLPPARDRHNAVWDPADTRMLVFGGATNSGRVNDLWSYGPEETPPSCTLTQSASYAGGTMTLNYTIGTTVPATWNIWIVVGSSIFPVASIALPVIAPPFSTGPISFAFPSSGVVGFLTTLTTPVGGVICWDWDTVSTGAAAPGATAPEVPALTLPNGAPGRG